MDDDNYNEGEQEAFLKCPTCGRFVSRWEGYSDLPPGGRQDVDYIVAYCNEDCAARKDPPAIYEEN
jgi:hypothetical protein